MTKIAILSDIHLTSHIPYNHFGIPDADIYVLAGDIDEGTHGASWVDERFRNREVVIVPGNHEYYNYELNNAQDSLLNFKWSNIKAGGYFNNSIYYNNRRKIRFICSTLWSDCSSLPHLFDANAPLDRYRLERSINDFYMIRNGDIKFSVDKMVELYVESREFLLEAIQTPYKGKTVVVTHFPPSLKSMAERFRLDPISAYFMNDLGAEYFEGVDVWIHGHTHHRISYEIGKCRVICHPRGYRKEIPGKCEFKIIDL